MRSAMGTVTDHGGIGVTRYHPAMARQSIPRPRGTLFLSGSEITAMASTNDDEDWIMPFRDNLIPIETSLFKVILDLIRRDDVHSVSCPFTDPALWRALVGEQLRRSEQSGLPLQEAFWLSGPDSGLENIPVKDWGGEVHILYEGASGADLFILPAWHRFFAEKVKDGGKLRWAIHKPCHHVLLYGDYGELGCATRTVFGDWTLYTSTAPYEKYNPFFVRFTSESIPDFK
jgi:hypothetical protein